MFLKIKSQKDIKIGTTIVQYSSYNVFIKFKPRVIIKF